MKILIVADVPNWAIGKLSQAIVKHNPQHAIEIAYQHPRDIRITADFEQAIDDADVIHFQYWRTAQQIIEALPRIKSKNTILTHHNQKNLLSCDWKEFGIKRHICHTKKAQGILLDAGYEQVGIIQHGIDLSEFTYSEKLPSSPMVGYCGRIVPWKGLKEVATACYELGIPLMMMGKHDKPDYWESIPLEVRSHIDISYMNAEDDERRDFYRKLTLYVGNSGDNHEEGTLPFLEAMACGVPVVTTPSGEAADLIENGKNGVIVPFGDYEALKVAISANAEPCPKTEELRKNGWSTIKTLDERKMAYQYSVAYQELASQGDPLVSVILPTYNRKENVIRILEALRTGSWGHHEVIVADDGSSDDTQQAIALYKQENPHHTVRIIDTELLSPPKEGGATMGEGWDLVKDYGLARARNSAVVEAQGEFLMFLDSRLLPSPEAIRAFLKAIWVRDSEGRGKKLWMFGDKGSQKQTFVENFSFIRRDLFIQGGMCNERINLYGGMSQELRERFKALGFTFEYVDAAKCSEMGKSGFGDTKRAQIVEMKLKLFKMGL